MTMINPPISSTFLTYRKALSVLLALFLFGYRPCPAQIPSKTAVLPSKEEILDAIGSKELAHDPHLHFQIKPWNNRPGSFLAMVYITASVSDDLGESDAVEVVRAARLQPTLALLEFVNGRWITSAKSSGPHGFGNHCRELPRGADQVDKTPDTPGDPGHSPDGDLCKEFDFDFAPYRITPTETVIGVRTKFHSFYIAGEGEYEDLTLFELVGHELKPVFSEIMSSSMEERGPNEMDSSKTVLQVSPQKTRDHFDLLVVEHHNVETLTDGPSTNRPGRTLSKRRFVWNGTAYVEVK
ncbi:hypothetical protein [Granulicella sp. S156]|uniref:hypothetical protein n=1 Tax=Granulicella sp. S156 TaxID=1747224 RepID=UPI00131ACD18|nr:hypothetical protein [Granulicella sp. S156]